MRVYLRLNLFAIAMLAASPLWGAGGTATDGAVTLTYPSTHWGDGPYTNLLGTEPSASTDCMYQMGWWYRAEGDTREYPLPAPDAETYSNGQVFAVWNNIDGKGFSAQELTFVFDNEGPSGSVWSSFAVFNNNASAQTFSLFHYLDVDVGGTAPNDVGQKVSSRFLKFTDGAAVVRYRSYGAAHFSVKPFPQIRTMLNDAAVNDLDDTGLPFGPGDVTAAVERTESVDPGQSMGVDVSVSSRLPSDHIRGAYADLTSYPALQTYDVVSGDDLSRAFRRTTHLEHNESYGIWLPGSQIVARDDFNGDSNDDVVARNARTGETTINNVALSGAASPSPDWTFASTGDFNADGKADILWHNESTGQLLVWLMNGSEVTASMLPNPDHATGAGWVVAGTADFNADGARDILWYNQTSGNLVIWYMNAALQRLWAAPTAPASFGCCEWRVVAVGDFGRGRAGVLNSPDIVWQNHTTHDLVVWFMDFTGTRTWSAYTTPANLGASALVTGPR